MKWVLVSRRLGSVLSAAGFDVIPMEGVVASAVLDGFSSFGEVGISSTVDNAAVVGSVIPPVCEVESLV